MGIGLAIRDRESSVRVRSLRGKNRAETGLRGQFRRDRSLYCGPPLSANPHELEQTIDVLVLVKAYPQPSTKYTESVCVAGLGLGEAMAIYRAGEGRLNVRAAGAPA